jgi:hypothetical protein
MRSKVAKRILADTPVWVKRKVENYTKSLLKNQAMESILLAGGYIDLYVSRKKFVDYKKESSRKAFVLRELEKIFNNLRGFVTESGVEIRLVEVTSNNYWGVGPVTIPDIGFSCYNHIKPLENDDEKIALRVFQVDLVGVILPESSCRHFDKIVLESATIFIGSYRVI